jgi:ribosomal protein S18 acetylase RimI-like enzyme
MVTVRPMGLPDCDAAAEVWWRSRMAAIPEIPPPIHTEEEVRRWFRDVLLPDAQTWIALAGSRPVAVLTLDGDDLDQLYVDPAFAGQGIGSMLVDLAKSLRPEGLELWTFQSNHPAQAFYRRHGFTELYRTDGADNEERAPDIRMAWRPRPRRARR